MRLVVRRPGAIALFGAIPDPPTFPDTSDLAWRTYSEGRRQAAEAYARDLEIEWPWFPCELQLAAELYRVTSRVAQHPAKPSILDGLNDHERAALRRAIDAALDQQSELAEDQPDQPGDQLSGTIELLAAAENLGVAGMVDWYEPRARGILHEGKTGQVMLEDGLELMGPVRTHVGLTIEEEHRLIEEAAKDAHERLDKLADEMQGPTVRGKVPAKNLEQIDRDVAWLYRNRVARSPDPEYASIRALAREAFGEPDDRRQDVRDGMDRAEMWLARGVAFEIED
jgi:hypothetical protein